MPLLSASKHKLCNSYRTLKTIGFRDNLKEFRGNLCNFAAVKTTRRQISAFVLLAVFLPMLVLSSLHIHEAPQTIDTECSDCVHHSCHGHLTATATWAHDCVLCQFLTLTTLTAAMMAVTVYIHVCKKSHAQPLCDYHTACCGTSFKRGPPPA